MHTNLPDEIETIEKPKVPTWMKELLLIIVLIAVAFVTYLGGVLAEVAELIR